MHDGKADRNLGGLMRGGEHAKGHCSPALRPATRLPLFDILAKSFGAHAVIGTTLCD